MKSKIPNLKALVPGYRSLLDEAVEFGLVPDPATNFRSKLPLLVQRMGVPVVKDELLQWALVGVALANQLPESNYSPRRSRGRPVGSVKDARTLTARERQTLNGLIRLAEWLGEPVQSVIRRSVSRVGKQGKIWSSQRTGEIRKLERAYAALQREADMAKFASTPGTFAWSFATTNAGKPQRRVRSRVPKK